MRNFIDKVRTSILKSVPQILVELIPSTYLDQSFCALAGYWFQLSFFEESNFLKKQDWFSQFLDTMDQYFEKLS